MADKSKTVSDDADRLLQEAIGYGRISKLQIVCRRRQRRPFRDIHTSVTARADDLELGAVTWGSLKQRLQQT